MKTTGVWGQLRQEVYYVRGLTDRQEPIGEGKDI